MGILDKLLGTKSDAKPVHVDDSNFRAEILDHDGPLLLDVWGPGCAPCQRLVPVLRALAKDYDGRVKICEVNAAEAPKTASRLGVRGTPTIIAYRRRSEIGRVVGYHPKSYFDQLIEAEFSSDPEERTDKDSGQSVKIDDAAGLSKKARKKREKKARRKAH